MSDWPSGAMRQSSSVLPSPSPLSGWFDAHPVMVHVTGPPHASVTVGRMSPAGTGTYLWFGGHRHAVIVPADVTIGGCVSATVTLASQLLDAEPLSTVSVTLEVSGHGASVSRMSDGDGLAGSSNDPPGQSVVHAKLSVRPAGSLEPVPSSAMVVVPPEHSAL